MRTGGAAMLRRVLTTLVPAFAGLALLAASAAAQTVKIGVILTYSGPFAQVGDEIDKGLKLYIKEHEKELPAGVKLELVIRDDTGPNPDVAKRLAQELITRDHVQLLTGVLASPNAAAVAPLTAEAKLPFVMPLSAGVAPTRLSPYTVRVPFTLRQITLPMAPWADKQGAKTAYIALSALLPGP